MMRAAWSGVAASMVLAFGAIAGAQQLDVTGKWSLTGTDEKGTQWTAEISVGQSPVAVNGKYSLTGTILWTATGGDFAAPVSAEEDFSDTVYGTQCYLDTDTRLLHIEGYNITDISSQGRITVAVTEATVSADGKQLADGTGTGKDVVPGTWSGTRLGDVVSLTIGAGTVKGNSMIFPLELSTASPQPVTAEYETGDGTAHRDVDYGYTFGTLTINPGKTSATITVPLLSGATPDRDFIMQLYKVNGAIRANHVADGAIPANWLFTPVGDNGGGGTDNGGGGADNGGSNDGGNTPITPAATGLCGTGVGAGNLIGFYAMCWLGLAGLGLRRKAR